MGSLNIPATLFCWKSSDSSSLSVGLSWCGNGILEKPVYREFRELPLTHLVAHSERCVKGFMSVRPCAGLCRVSRHEGAGLLAFPCSFLFCIDPVLCFFFFFNQESLPACECSSSWPLQTGVWIWVVWMMEAVRPLRGNTWWGAVLTSLPFINISLC